MPVRRRMLWRRTWPAKLPRRHGQQVEYSCDACIGFIRNMNDELLVCVALDFWLGIEALRPSLLYYFSSAASHCLIQSLDGVPFDLFV